MSEQADEPQAGRRRATRKRRPSLHLRRWALGVLVLLVAAGALTAWIGVRGLVAKHHLTAAQAESDQLRTALVDDGDDASAAALLAQVKKHTARAHALTSDLVWRAAGHLPAVGSSAAAVTTTTTAVDQVAQQVLPTLVAQAGALAPSKIRVEGDRLDVTRIRAAGPQLAAAQAKARTAADHARTVDAGALPAPLGRAVAKAQHGLDEVAELTTNASDAAKVLPPMLGADGPRRYFLGFQSNAEARATGGLLGAYGVLEADHGKIRVLTLAPRSTLDRGDLAKPAIDFGADYRSLYGDDPGLWVNTNLSPHFPYAAQLWLAMYEKQFGQKLDGAIATDPVALGYVLGATGPTTLLDGTTVTEQNAPRLTMRDVYSRYPDSDAKRDAFLQAVARGVVTNLLAGEGSPSKLATALGRSAGEGRLSIYSTRVADESVLATTPLGGSDAAQPGPQVGVFVNSGSASKLDYYLDAAVDYHVGGCGRAQRASTVTITMASTAPASGLTRYVTGPPGPGGGVSDLDLVAVHLPVGAEVKSVTIDDKAIGFSPHRLLGRPVVTFPVRLDAGARRAVVLDLVEPTTPGPPAIRAQALATQVRTSTSGSTCGS